MVLCSQELMFSRRVVPKAISSHGEWRGLRLSELHRSLGWKTMMIKCVDYSRFFLKNGRTHWVNLWHSGRRPGIHGNWDKAELQHETASEVWIHALRRISKSRPETIRRFCSSEFRWKRRKSVRYGSASRVYRTNFCLFEEGSLESGNISLTHRRFWVRLRFRDVWSVMWGSRFRPLSLERSCSEFCFFVFFSAFSLNELLVSLLAARLTWSACSCGCINVEG